MTTGSDRNERPPQMPPFETREEILAWVEEHGRPLPPLSEMAIPDLPEDEAEAFLAVIRDL